MWIALAIVVLGVVAFAATSLAWGTRRWQRATAEAVARLEEAPRSTPVARYDEREAARLPACVARYFRIVLRPNQPMVVCARVDHEGRFRASEGEPWRPFASTERFVVSPPGFVWDARIRVLRGIALRVREAHVGGAASLHAEAFGRVRAGDVSDSPELRLGALQRYLAEAVWLPTALLPSQGVEWTAVDDSSARATLREGETIAAIDFRFDRVGHIATAFAEARPRSVAGGFEPTPWTCRYSTWVNRGGMQVPLEGEAAWKLADRPLPYWHGRLAKVEYTFAS